jgi:hypothetical protein
VSNTKRTIYYNYFLFLTGDFVTRKASYIWVLNPNLRPRLPKFWRLFFFVNTLKSNGGNPGSVSTSLDLDAQKLCRSLFPVNKITTKFFYYILTTW